MNTGKLGVSILSFIAALMTLVASYLALNLYSITSGAALNLSLGIPGLTLGQPREGHATSSRSYVPEARQFTLFLTMIKDASGGENHRWFPSSITANAGDTIILRIVNTDNDAAHGFGIAGYGIFDPGIAPGATKTFQFTANRAGIFRFACALPECASDHGDQEGQLVVLASQ